MRSLPPAFLAALGLSLVAPLTAQTAACPDYSTGGVSAGLSRFGGGEDARLVYVDCLPSIGVVYAKFGVPGGASMLDTLPLTIAVYDDPSNDMDPTDAVLVAQVSVPGGVTGSNTGAWQRYDLAALTGAVIPATGGTWVAVGVAYPANISPGPGSIEFVSRAPGTQWLATDSGTGLNYASLATASLVDVQTGPGFPPGTWAIAVDSGADQRAFGAGCTGSNGVPTLAASPGFSPTPGQVIVLDVTNLPLPSAPAAIVLGFDRFDPVPDLGTFAGGAATGCPLYVQPSSWELLTVANGASAWAVQLPTNTALVGLAAFTQVLAIDSGANSMGVTVSNGMRTVIGY